MTFTWPVFATICITCTILLTAAGVSFRRHWNKPGPLN